ncbi:glycosyltransferase [Nocardioides sp. WV_118_6]
MRSLVNGFGAHHGGIVRVHDALCAELRAYGPVVVANAPRSPSGPGVDGIDGVDGGDGIEIASTQRSSRMGSFLGDAWAARRAPRFDVRVDAAPALRFLTRSRAHVVVVHDLNFRRPEIHGIGRGQRLYRVLLHHWTLRRADRVVVNSRATAAEVAAFRPAAAAKTLVLPLPVDHVAVPAPVAPARDRTDRTVRLLTFGHARNKGVDRLLRLLHERPDHRLTVIGTPDSWQAHWAATADRLGVADRVTRLEAPGDAEVVAAYLACDVFCMLSTYEGYGLPVAEALRLARPTVVSDLPVLAETARGHAVVAQGDDDAAVAAAVDEARRRPVAAWESAARAFGAWTWRSWVARAIGGLG